MGLGRKFLNLVLFNPSLELEEKRHETTATKGLVGGAFGMHAGNANGNGQVQNDDKNDYWQFNVGLGTQVPP